jgi:hypothetical protein
LGKKKEPTDGARADIKLESLSQRCCCYNSTVALFSVHNFTLFCFFSCSGGNNRTQKLYKIIFLQFVVTDKSKITFFDSSDLAKFDYKAAAVDAQSL